MQFSKNLPIFFLSILILLFVFALFYHINHVPFASFDESRHGVSALEMLHDHHYIVNTWAGKPDFWNLKPVLSFLPTMLSVSLFGKSILSIRLFSILSAIMLCGTGTIYTTTKHNIYCALLFISLLFTTGLIIRNHGFRSGEIDSFFILCQFTVAIILSYRPNVRTLTTAAFISSLAFLAKSWHALFMGLPYIIAYAYLFRNRRHQPICWQVFLFPLLGFAIPILIWLALRYPHDGFAFIKEMYWYDLLKRSTRTIENHSSDNGLFLHSLLHNYTVISVTFILSLIYSFHQRGKKFLTYDIIILFSAIFSSILIYSLAKTKIDHYAYTHLVLLCLISAILISRDISQWTKSFTFILVLIAFIFDGITLHAISSRHIPFYYKQLQENAYPKFDNLYVPGTIEQNERLAFMIFGNFNYDTIKHGKPDRNSLVFYRTGANDNSDITGCILIAKETLKVKNINWNETIRLYSCKAE